MNGGFGMYDYTLKELILALNEEYIRLQAEVRKLSEDDCTLKNIEKLTNENILSGKMISELTCLYNETIRNYINAGHIITSEFRSELIDLYCPLFVNSNSFIDPKLFTKLSYLSITLHHLYFQSNNTLLIMGFNDFLIHINDEKLTKDYLDQLLSIKFSRDFFPLSIQFLVEKTRSQNGQILLDGDILDNKEYQINKNGRNMILRKERRVINE